MPAKNINNDPVASVYDTASFFFNVVNIYIKKKQHTNINRTIRSEP